MDSGRNPRKEPKDVHMKDQEEADSEPELEAESEDLYGDKENDTKPNILEMFVENPAALGITRGEDLERILQFADAGLKNLSGVGGEKDKQQADPADDPIKPEDPSVDNKKQLAARMNPDPHRKQIGANKPKNPQASPPRVPLQQLNDDDEDNKNRDGSNTEDSESEDPYKPEGTVRLDIDRFSEFARGLPTENPQRLSEPVFIRGMPWKILAIPREGNRSPARSNGKCLGFFLQCNGETGADHDNWSCMASGTLRVCSQREGMDHHQRKISHTFHPKENDWGYSQFIHCDNLLDENNGYIKDDMVRLEVDVTADAPHGLHWDSKRHAGFIGLRNQGATCYMNSILQTLFFTNKLRKAVYLMPTEEDDQDSSVALAMQRVFFELQFSDVPVGTRKLTKSFGWDAVDSFLQHDVQELCRVLLDNLESKMKATSVEDTIPMLFKGLMRSYVRCIDVSFESARDEYFYDVQLNVKGKPNIIESFRDYTEPEILDGENMYDAGDLGMQKAEKGVKFVSFPPVLHLQLMRFQYDPQLDTNVKINDRFEFPEVLQLNEFIDECGTQDDYTYLLQAVLVHAGDFHGGHYVVYINTNLRSDSPRWCKFDDDVVARSPTREAVTNNYGGDESEGAGRSCSNAYMLVYVQQNKINDVLCPVQERDIPRHLRARFENEKEEELLKRREREQATLYCDVTLVTDENLAGHHGFDIGNYDEIKNGKSGHTIRIPKSSNARDFYAKVAEALNLPIDGLRLWKFDVVYGKDDGFTTSLESHRPRSFIFCPPDDVAMNTAVLEPKGENIFYVEAGKPMPLVLADNPMQPHLMLSPYDRESSVLAFVKLYEAARKKFTYVGSLILSLDDQLAAYHPTICSMVGLQRDAKLNLYLEVAPDHIYQICSSNQPIRGDRNLVVDGIIIIVEDAESVSDENNCSVACNKMFAHMQVEAMPNNDFFTTNLNSPSDVFLLDLQMDSSLQELCDELGKRLDYDPKKIVLWRSTVPTERPGSLIMYEEFQRCTMHDLISMNGNFMHDPRVSRPYPIYYSKIPILFEELDNHKHLRVSLMDHKFQIKEFSVFPPKGGSVKDILECAKAYFEFSPNGTGKLRLVHVLNIPSQSRVYQVLDNDITLDQLPQRMYCNSLSPSASGASLRVEEIPADQQTIAPTEYLLPVSHYEKEPSKMFGVPFLIKIVNEESVANIKKRVKEILGIPDREFEKFKFSLIMNNRIVRDFDQSDTATVNLNELKTMALGPTNMNTPMLGIDHANKHRSTRSHHTEKAIVIHN